MRRTIQPITKKDFWRKLKISMIACIAILTMSVESKAQTTDRPRPADWNNLVFGGRFMDRFLPMPKIGVKTSDTWGGENVVPRYVNNGIENRIWSFWGGNIIKESDSKYHLFVCGWLESSPRGHGMWPKSTVFHATSNSSFGPFVVKDTIGKGHNPEAFRLKDGRYVIYVIDGYYVSNGFDGPWEYKKFEFNNRDRKIIEGLSNLTFAQREDKSYLMICRGGGVWISETGNSSYNQITEKRAYPPVKGRFEDPVIWKTNVQYNMVVNDWLGRIAWYLRSKDGVTWKTDAGEAYMPGISKNEDGTEEGWFKYERMKIFQDKYGRATQANFAVIDVEKKFDIGSDNHSSKNIVIPLTVEKLLTILDKDRITTKTKTIRVKVEAEKGFNPQTDMDINSLRFGASEEVNFGRGCKVLKTEKDGENLIVTFDGAGNGLPEDEFAAKLLGKTSDGKLLYGYARLPGVKFIEPILSARLPEITANKNGFGLKVEVQNFGQVASKSTLLTISYTKKGQNTEIAKGKIPSLKPYEKTTLDLSCGSIFEKEVVYDFVVTISPKDQKPTLLHGKLTPVK